MPQLSIGRLFRFSLRTMLVVCGGLCALLGWKVHEVHTQKMAVAWVEKMGGAVIYDYQLDGALEPSIQGENPGPDWLCKLIGVDYFATVESVGFYEARVTDLEPLANLSHLEFLILDRTQVRDLSPLSKMTKLRALDVSHIPATDISPLALLTNLERLRMEGTVVSDLSPLANLPNLMHLNLRGVASFASDEATELQKALPHCTIVHIGGDGRRVDPSEVKSDLPPKNGSKE